MSSIPVCTGKIFIVTGGAQAPFQCFQSDGFTLGVWTFYEESSPPAKEFLLMTQSIKCQGQIKVVTGNAQAPFQCYQSDGVTLGTWVFYETPVITEVSAPEISDILFVLTLCVAFALGFHKGGQR